MNYDVHYSPKAGTDIEGIWDIVSSVSQDYDIADRYISGLISEIESKREFPRSGVPLVYRGLFTGFYSVLFKKYLAFYRVWDGYIEVARVLPASSDYIKVLMGEPADDETKLSED